MQESNYPPGMTERDPIFKENEPKEPNEDELYERERDLNANRKK